jgi:UDP-glucose 4-epimerase
MKKILVTGGYSFIGSYVIEELIKQGFQPVTTVRHHEPNGYIPKEVIIYEGDMRDTAFIYSVVQKVDGVIHLAGLLGTSENMRFAKIMNEVNIGGALNVLDAIDNFKIPASFISVGNHFENNPYSISKSTAERYALCYAKNFGTKVNVTRTYDAIGPRQKWGKVNKILPTFINKALRNEDISVYGGKEKCSVIDLVYAGDVAEVLIEVLKRSEKGEKGQVFEAGSGIGLKVYDIASKVIEVCQSTSKIIEVPMRQGESEKAHVVAKNPYPIEYRSFESALLETVTYYKDLMK